MIEIGLPIPHESVIIHDGKGHSCSISQKRDGIFEVCYDHENCTVVVNRG